MGLATDFKYIVDRCFNRLILKELLQARLGVFAYAVRIDAVEERLIQVQHNRTRCLKIAVLVDRTKHGLQGIGENGIAVKATALEFATAEFKVIAEIQVAGKLRQGLTPHQCRTQACQIALVELRESVVECVGDHKAQDAVAQKFKTFVILVAVTAVSQGAREQRRIAEDDSQTLGEIVVGTAQRAVTCTLSLKSSKAEMLWKSGTRRS